VYQIKTGVDRIEGVFSANLANVDKLIKRLRSYMIRNNLEKESFTCELLAREALNNAIFHVSGEDLQKKTTFIAEFRPREIIMKFSDEGHGFDWRKCLSEEYDPRGTSGRGLLLLKLYTTEFLYNEKGNELLITISRHLPKD
jgi:anti-sigma regulatory factor (Ser/Thr protein kinase)